MTLYLTDLDGTLLNYAAKLKPRAAEMLNRAINKGTLFSYATARRLQSSKEILKNVNITLPVITMNGVILVDPVTEKRLHTEYIPEEGLEKAKKLIIENNETPMIYALVDGKERVNYMRKSHKAASEWNAARKDDPCRIACDSYEELFEGEIYFITILNPESKTDELDAVFSRENGFSVASYIDTYPPHYHIYEAWSAKASKATAALKLKKLIGADKIIAFGDNVNDIEMFKAADECYAVENAVDELKAIATGFIGSNESMGVPIFIEKHTAKIWDYTTPDSEKIPDKARFSEALKTASEDKGIGTLNEKPVHAVLKSYFSQNSDCEIKIGRHIADTAGENGIYEVQTAGWDKLRGKLDVFLDASHVTAVYPFSQRVHNINIDENTGELVKRSPARNNKDLSRFFLELYRIKGFLTHPNLTVCIAGLEVEILHYIDPKNPRRRKQKKSKKPLALLSEIHLNGAEDYRQFLPEGLPEPFSRKEFIKLSRKADGSILLEILEYMSVVQKIGKKGNEFIFSASQL